MRLGIQKNPSGACSRKGSFVFRGIRRKLEMRWSVRGEIEVSVAGWSEGKGKRINKNKDEKL